MDEIVEYLEQSGKYEQLLANWHQRNDDETRFEVLFAFWCESRGLTLNYEVSVNPDNDKTIDFNFITNNDVTINLELVRPDLNKGIKDQLSGDVLQGYILTSNHQDPDFRTCAQQIKLQWALLEKVEKFPELSETTINIIVADCSNVHAGMFDRHDLEMAMYGYPGNPIWQEYWEGKKLIGMWENGYNQRGSEKFCERISAVFFVPKQTTELLEKALTALNPLNSKEHRRLIIDELKKYQAFVDVQVVQ
jgi:hypothetical protein